MLQTTGWLKNYLQFRLEHPFVPLASYQNAPSLKVREDFDTCLYQMVQENGVLLGCPVVDENAALPWQELGFPEKYTEVIFVYLETLFSVTMQEKKILRPQETNEADLLKQVTLDILHFYLKRVDDPLYEGEGLRLMLRSDQTFLKALKQLEKEINKQIIVKKTMFSVSGNLQNLFGFLEIYYFLQWHFACLQTNEEPDVILALILEQQAQMKEQIIMLFGALVWADEVVVPVEAQVMQQYIDQVRLPLKVLKKVQKRIKQPVTLDDLSFSVDSLVLKKYILQTLILLSLIDNQQAPEERALIEAFSEQLGVGTQELDLLYLSMMAFFTDHGHRFDLLKNNPAVTKLDQYVRAKIMVAVKDSLDNIMTEIRETGELSTLLAKAASQPLTEEEKRKVKEQLLDIAKTIPALAIFCLPAGGIVLAVLIKVLPFNILPSSFNENS